MLRNMGALEIKYKRKTQIENYSTGFSSEAAPITSEVLD